MTQNSKDPHVPTLGAPSQKTSMLQVRPRFTGLSRSAVALFQLGTYRAHMAAALMIVAVSLLYQTGAEALEQSSKKVLYLDAPSVSVPQAQKAGETAWGYAGPDSNVDDSVLAWVDVKPVPQEARKAFASVTDPSGQPPGGVSYDDAMAAGEAMVAQLGGDSPATEDNGDNELAAADPVRPKLGDGTKATDAPVPGGAEQPTPASGPDSRATGSDSGQPEYAAADRPTLTDLGLPAPMAEEYAPEPSTEQPAEQPLDSNDRELAAVPEDASEDTGEGTGGNSDTGPISDGYSPEATSSEPSDGSPGSPDEATPQGEPEPSSSDVSQDPQGDQASPTIVVLDSPASGDELEQEYAKVPEGSGTKPETSETETSEPENTGTPPDEPSSDSSSEPSPASTAEELEEPSDSVAVVPYDSSVEESQDESQEGLEQPTAERSSGPSTDETESYSPEPEPDQQGASPEEAAANPTPAEEEPAGADPAVQQETESNAELGAGEDTEDMGIEEELPEGVQIESSDESGVQKLSVVVHQESENTDTPKANPPDAQETPESAPSEPSEFEQPPPASHDNEGPPYNGHDESQNPEAGQAPRPATSGRPGSEGPDQPGAAPGRDSESGADSGTDQNDHNGDDSSPAPQPALSDGQEPSSPPPSWSTSAQSQGRPETTSKPRADGESSPQTTPADQSRQGSQLPDQEDVSKQEPGASAPESAPAPKDQTSRRDAEGTGEGAQSNDRVQNPAQSPGAKESKQQRQQSQPSQPPAREPRQSTAPAEASPDKVSQRERGGGTGAQSPTQSADALQIKAQTAPQVEPQVELGPVPASQPLAPAAATNMPESNQAAPALRNQRAVQRAARREQRAAASQVVQPADTATQGYVEDAVDPYVEDVAADAAPAETYAEPATQVPAKQLEPVQQVPTQELDPAPRVANVLESGSAAAQPNAVPTGSTPPAPAQQAQEQVVSTVDTAVQQKISTGGGK